MDDEDEDDDEDDLEVVTGSGNNDAVDLTTLLWLSRGVLVLCAPLPPGVLVSPW